jgi:replicative DNA helicase
MFSIEKLLNFALSDESIFLLLRGALTNDLAIANPYYLQIANFYDDFYQKYSGLPQDGDLKIWLSDFPDNQRTALKSAIQHVRAQDISGYTKDYVIDEAVDGLRNVATKNAIKRMDSTTNTSPEVMADMLDQINKIRTATLSNLVDLKDTGRWLRIKEEHEVKWKSRIRKLDKYIGGFGDELVFVLAGTGVGKTTALLNFGKAAAFEGANVLHISLELFDSATAHRYYRRIAEATKDEFSADYEKVKELVEHWMGYSKGNIHITYYPAFSISVLDVKNIVRQYVEEYGHVDFIILDYLDLLEADKSYRNLDGWAKLGRMSHEIRALCSEYEATVISAAQANREGIDASSLKMKHMAGSVQKLQAADIVIGLMQDEEEALVNQGRLGLLKVRENPGKGMEIPLYIDMDRMTMLDLDDPDSQRLIKERSKENAIQQQLYGADEE